MHPITLSFGLILLVGAPTGSALAQHPSHPAPTESVTDIPAQGYATDATLRQQMREIRGVVLALGHYEHDHITPELATQLADKITGHVNTIIIHCKLPPDADAALHLIVGPLLQDASTLKADPGRLDAIANMRQLLDQYARQFDDPGFPVFTAR
jgi:hypothetical protein